MQTSTISTSSTSTTSSILDRRPETAALDSDAAAEFVYESSCRLESKEYRMGAEVSHLEVPVTVAELGTGIPTTVEELNYQTKPMEERELSSQIKPKEDQTKPREEIVHNNQTKPREESAPPADRKSTEPENALKRTFSFSEEDRRVISLPPRPSHSFREFSIKS